MKSGSHTKDPPNFHSHFSFEVGKRESLWKGRVFGALFVTKLPNVSVGLLGSWRCDEILWGLICCCVLQEHLQQCLFESVQCTNDGCTDQIPRKDLKEHLSQHCKFREEMCQYCNKSVVLHNIKVRL